MFWHCMASEQWVWGVWGVLGYVLGGSWGVGGGTAVHIKASLSASRATGYGVEVTWHLGGVLNGAGEVVGARLDEGREGNSVSNGGWGELKWLGQRREVLDPKLISPPQRGGLKKKECPMYKRRSVHTCLLCNTLISLCVKRDMHNKGQISTEGT